MAAAVRQCPDIVPYLNDRVLGDWLVPLLLADRDNCLLAVAHDGAALSLAPAALRADKEVVLTACATAGWVLQLAPPALQDDKDVVLAAVMQDGTALRFASLKLRYDEGVVTAARRQSEAALEWAFAGEGAAAWAWAAFMSSVDAQLAATRGLQPPNLAESGVSSDVGSALAAEARTVIANARSGHRW